MTTYSQFMQRQIQEPQNKNGSPHTLYNDHVAFARDYGIDITGNVQGQLNQVNRLEGWVRPLFK